MNSDFGFKLKQCSDINCLSNAYKCSLKISTWILNPNSLFTQVSIAIHETKLNIQVLINPADFSLPKIPTNDKMLINTSTMLIKLHCLLIIFSILGKEFISFACANNSFWSFVVEAHMLCWVWNYFIRADFSPLQLRWGDVSSLASALAIIEYLWSCYSHSKEFSPFCVFMD